jgi:hypothetical protein
MIKNTITSRTPQKIIDAVSPNHPPACAGGPDIASQTLGHVVANRLVLIPLTRIGHRRHRLPWGIGDNPPALP